MEEELMRAKRDMKASQNKNLLLSAPGSSAILSTDSSEVKELKKYNDDLSVRCFNLLAPLRLVAHICIEL